jgi:hypothetical protein
VQELLGGNGYGTTATIGSTVRSGPTAWLAQSCFGGGTNRIAVGGQVALDSTGSSFTHLRVLGRTLDSNTVKPNITITLPGIGTLALRQTDTISAAGLHKIAVTMMQLTILRGPHTGTTLTAGTASASIRR